MARFRIPASELRWRFDTSGGPGGQHANRSSTRVELAFDVNGSSAFSDDERRRILERIGSEIRITEAGSRSQSANRRRALKRLHDALEDAVRPGAPPRRSTRPSKRARERRLSSKHHRAERKRLRRRPFDDS